MSDINLEFTVSNNSIEFTVDPIDLTFTPEDIQLTINPSYSPGAGGNVGELQYNNGSLLGGVPFTTYDGANLLLGNVANLKITGGVNGYFLQTDGTGNLNWAAGGGGGGNGTPGGSNTQIQYNDNGTFGGNTGFTFNEVSGNVAIPGNLSVVGNITGNVQTANLANLANFATVANSVAGANVSGQVGNALIAGTVYTNAQPNITSVGNLTSLIVTGNITAGNANLGNTVSANYFIGDGTNISNITVSKLANGTSNINIPVANGPIYITPGGASNIAVFNTNGVSTLQSILSNGLTFNIGGGISFNDSKVRIQNYGANGNGNYQITIGTGLAGNFSNAIAIGNGSIIAGVNGVAIGAGPRAAQDTVSIGSGAGAGGDARRGVFVGYQAGQVGNSSISGEIGGVAIGAFSGYRQSDGSIAVGYQAANVRQDFETVAIGFTSGMYQANYAIAIGSLAGYGNAGANAQGSNSIAIGYRAGFNTTHANSIILNSTGGALDSTQADSLFVKPIRDVTGNAGFTVQLYYNPTTGEIGYK